MKKSIIHTLKNDEITIVIYKFVNHEKLKTIIQKRKTNEKHKKILEL